MREHRVMFVGGKSSEGETTELALTVEKEEAKQEDVDQVAATIKGLGNDPTEDEMKALPIGDKPIKQEPGTEVVITDPAMDLSRVQSQLLDVKMMRGKAIGIRYSEALVKDMDGLIVQLKRTEKALEALVIKTDMAPDEKAMQKLKLAISKNDTTYRELMDWANRFGIESGKNSKKPRRK